MADLPINAMTGKPFDPTLPMFHGTSSSFNLGDVIAPAEVAGVPSVHNSEHLTNLTSNAFATQDIDRARAYAEKAAKRSGGSPLVYRVEPVDLTNLAFDMDAPDDSSWMSSKGFRVVSPAEKDAVGKTAVDFANGSIHYAPDGRSYFLHHSGNSEIGIGNKINLTNPGRQATAGDAVGGHSYAWDARTGVNESIFNQVSVKRQKRGVVKGAPTSAGHIAYEYVDGGAPDELKPFSVYLTSADTKNVFPDINVPNSPARAITSAQDILDEVVIHPNASNDEALGLVRKMMKRHGIFEETNRETRKAIDLSVTLDKGEEAIDNYLVGASDMTVMNHINEIKKQMATGGRRGLYLKAPADPNSGLDHLSQIGKIFEEERRRSSYGFW